MNYILRTIIAVVVVAMSVCACTKKNDEIVTNPAPQEQELITTIRLVVTNSSGFNKTFTYKVDNGFNSTLPAPPVVDDLVLSANASYNVSIMVLDESKTPVEDITTEVKAENKDHLFVLESTPSLGAGSIIVSNGSKDVDGNPFNQTVDFTTGNKGNGSLIVTLKHQPTNKNAITAIAAGGETDAKATFPIILE